MADLVPEQQEEDSPAAPGDNAAGRRIPRPPLLLNQRGPLARAHALLAAHPVVDGCNGLPWALRQRTGEDPAPGAPPRRIGDDRGAGRPVDLDHGDTSVRTDIPRLRAGRVGGQFWSLQVPSDLPGEQAVGATLEQIDLVHTLVRTHPRALRLALTADDLTEARNHGRIASLLGSAGGHAIDSSLSVLRAFHRLGVRALALTADRNTPWADSATDRPKAGGLTPFGEEVVREMNRLGMLIDLSGASADTMRHTLAITKSPVFLCCSAARAVTGHARNVPDDVLSQLPRNGGICMVTFTPEHIARDGGPASVQDVADHLDHARTVAGPDHVGIGAGFDTDTATETATATDTDAAPDMDADAAYRGPLSDVAGYPQLIAELIDRGWSFRDLSGLTWGNALRAVRGAECAARAVRCRRVPSTATIGRLDGARG
ncbi:dipeptidase [Streptomyces halobius]|uniref:Dipeptidase n=1 Tax=Streptomyces halobius TaxID=2879846 RepID=A0ABY4MBC0_9ACTN|nr:dipeptidase [Streptomyces halobius]UQA95075.1 dipeptidase [Streptomyces halobius]